MGRHIIPHATVCAARRQKSVGNAGRASGRQRTVSCSPRYGASGARTCGSASSPTSDPLGRFGGNHTCENPLTSGHALGGIGGSTPAKPASLQGMSSGNWRVYTCKTTLPSGRPNLSVTLNMWKQGLPGYGHRVSPESDADRGRLWLRLQGTFGRRLYCNPSACDAAVGELPNSILQHDHKLSSCTALLHTR